MGPYGNPGGTHLGVLAGQGSESKRWILCVQDLLLKQ